MIIIRINLKHRKKIIFSFFFQIKIDKRIEEKDNITTEKEEKIECAKAEVI